MTTAVGGGFLSCTKILEEEKEKGEESLLSLMKEAAKEKNVPLSFLSAQVKSMKDASWGKGAPHSIPLVTFAQSVKQLQDEGRASDGSILRAWAYCLETAPGKAAYFVEDFSKYCRQLSDEELIEHERIKRMERGGRKRGYWRNGKLEEVGYAGIGAVAGVTA